MVTLPLLLAVENEIDTFRALIEAGANLNIKNNDGKSAIELTIRGNTYHLELLEAGALESESYGKRFPAPPNAQEGALSCRTKCFNGDCFRTYSDGKKVRFQADRIYNAFTQQWEWDSGTC